MHKVTIALTIADTTVAAFTGRVSGPRPGGVEVCLCQGQEVVCRGRVAGPGPKEEAARTDRSPFSGRVGRQFRDPNRVEI